MHGITVYIYVFILSCSLCEPFKGIKENFNEINFKYTVKKILTLIFLSLHLGFALMNVHDKICN